MTTTGTTSAPAPGLQGAPGALRAVGVVGDAGAATGALRLGTRRSALAMTQSRQVAQLLAERSGREVRLVEVVTHGDVSAAPLSVIGGTGVFTSALRAALLAGEVDLAVHSLKDLPTAPAPGLVLAAVPAREDPRDVLVARDGATLAQLPAGARVGTGSPRRAAQLRAVRPDLEVVDVRGNVDTRLRLVAEGAVDAVVLARAGLLRLGLESAATEVLDPEVVVPAPGQGALAVECRADDAATAAACAGLDHAMTRAEVTAERALLAALEAGCTAPVGALATAGEGGQVHLRAVVASPDGALAVRRSASCPPAPIDVLHAAAVLGLEVAEALLADGAGAVTGPDATLLRSAGDAEPAPPDRHPTGLPPAPAPQALHPQHVTAVDDLPERRHP